jgi:uncharacterized membrane protein
MESSPPAHAAMMTDRQPVAVVTVVIVVMVVIVMVVIVVIAVITVIVVIVVIVVWVPYEGVPTPGTRSHDEGQVT